ncbi:hypothetical protein BGX31_002544 [Mortierella sp. GBA43]|nr:hypothetical protein BGX31_002544 [Mortierella sp. GBA43]
MNVDPVYHTMLLELRSMKDFAAICQFINMFHPAFALDDFETEDLELALVDPSSSAFAIDLQARMLRALTQDRRISFDNWAKYAQKEFENRAPDQNPWNQEDETDYDNFDLATKLMILTNLCEWQLDDPERFRANFEEEEEVAVEWQAITHQHALDNRLYRENPPPKKNTKTTKQAPPPSKAKAAPPPRRGTRRSTRGRKVEDSSEAESEAEFETPPITPGVEWEPVCITQLDWEEFAKVFTRSKHPSERALHALINHDILPKIVRDFKEKDKERGKLVAIANRKRSSRIVTKEFELQEKARLEAIRQQELQAVMDQRKKDILRRRAERERQQQDRVREERLKEREMRLKSRERAIVEREEKKRLQQQRIAIEREARQQRRTTGHHDDHSEESGGYHGEDGDEDEEEEDWVFDCVCGVHGSNLDDGELMIACGKCNVWQHVACLKEEDAAQGKSATDWEKVDFTCQRCIDQENNKAARKEKRVQKQKQEALTAGSAGSNGTLNTTTEAKKEVKKARKETRNETRNGTKSDVGRKKQAGPVSPRSGQIAHAPLTNGHYSHPMSYAGQPYTPSQSYHNTTSYHQTYFNGHPGPAHPHYPPYQSSQPPHQPSPYYQQPQLYTAGHVGQPNVAQTYPAYSNPLPGSMQGHVSMNHLPAPTHQGTPHQLHVDYGSSQANQQYQNEGPMYGQAPMSTGYGGQVGLTTATPSPISMVGTVQKRRHVDGEVENVERPTKMMNSHSA